MSVVWNNSEALFAGVVLGVSLAGSIGSMMGVFYTPPEQTFQKHVFWLVYSITSASSIRVDCDTGI
jgi:hypothetical protein